MSSHELLRDSVLRVGEVSAVEGRKIYVQVDRNKNLSDMFLDGDILTNIAVNSYLEIRKGFLSIIGRVEGERVQSDKSDEWEEQGQAVNTNRRILTVALSGYIDERGVFAGGTRELPLIGNEAYLLTKQKVHLMHNLVQQGAPSVSIATLFGEDIEIEFPIDGLFNSHIAIFGNTGSGKTNTLAALYQGLIRALKQRNSERFEERTRFVLIDFNGEYRGEECLTPDKKVYNLSTRVANGDRIPVEMDALLDIEVLSILVDATEKTQKPFLRRTLRFFRQVSEANNPEAYFRGVLQSKVRDTLQLADKVRATLLIDYFEQILPDADADGNLVDLAGDLDWYNLGNEFRLRDGTAYLRTNPNRIPDTILYRQVDRFAFGASMLGNLISALYLQLIADVITNRAQNEHIAPLINRLKAKKDEIEKLFSFGGQQSFWQKNVVVVNLHDVNIEMKKTIPLLLVKKLYDEQKSEGGDRTLSLIIDEAHNILSKQSSREAETWKDYRLETFEEVIKEGRKFGVFVTLASQRPSDISPTIASQAHNYFIHRLINQADLKMISSAVSYVDRVTEESIPTLPTGTCVFSGVVTQVPLKIHVRELDELSRPSSATKKFSDVVPPVENC
ncbi:ATP-binding protein [Pseudoxanthomonas putridarboris]|uniref:ATP-binding protein n=1 Tax=Pseudoxanthomonas putridarboris TaxID=752605 RepID=A0ABU9IW37_9GAMM